jgi:hypothetical protein
VGVRTMQTNISKGLDKIYSAFGDIGTCSKLLIKYGFRIFLLFFFLGAFLVIYNRQIVIYDSYFELIATSIVKSSFTILAEMVIGALVIDYIFKKN